MKDAKKVELPDSLQKQLNILAEFEKLLEKESGAEYDHSFVKAALESFEVIQYRTNMEVGPGYFRPNDQQKKDAMVRSFIKAAKRMYRGVEKRMENYALKGDPHQKHLATLFREAQKP
jgi:hypothetical protein